MQEWYILGVGKVSCLERCPQFRSVLIEREVPLYSLQLFYCLTHKVPAIYGLTHKVPAIYGLTPKVPPALPGQDPRLERFANREQKVLFLWRTLLCLEMNTHNDRVCLCVFVCVCDVHVLSIGECVSRSYNSTLQNRMERCDAAASSGRWECQVMSLTLVRLVLMGTCVRV